MEERLKALSFAFWVREMEDLVKGDQEARLWLDTGHEPAGFLWWCDATSKEPQSWRAMLLQLWEMRETKKARFALRRIQEMMKG
jgi:hypothetical protein